MRPRWVQIRHRTACRNRCRPGSCSRLGPGFCSSGTRARRFSRSPPGSSPRIPCACLDCYFVWQLGCSLITGALSRPDSWTAGCNADFAGPAQHSARTLATSTSIALLIIFAPVSPRPFHKVTMIPSVAVIDSEAMMRRRRSLRVGRFIGNFLFRVPEAFIFPTVRTAELPHMSTSTQLPLLSYLSASVLPRRAGRGQVSLAGRARSPGGW